MYGPFKKTWGFGHPGGFRYRDAAACHLRKPGAEKSQLGVQLVKCWLFDHLQGLPKALCWHAKHPEDGKKKES